MADILQKIMAHKRAEVAAGKTADPLPRLQEQIARADPTRGFAAAIRAHLRAQRPAVIAEIKQASPSKGVIRANFDPTQLAISYADGGASCLSVLTDAAFFQGHAQDLAAARQSCALPVLRKDFIIDPYQVYESRAIGADAVLLIVAALDDETLHTLYHLAVQLGLDALIEVHDRQELERALRLPGPLIGPEPLIGINNRNLRSFETRLETTLELLEWVPAERIVVAESGIHRPADVQRLQQQAVQVFLVGEALLRAEQPGEKMRELFAL